MKILLIAGHGQGDPGAVGSGYKEADLTREVVKLLKSRLDNYADVTIADTTKNWYKYENRANFDFTPYDYVLEIHFNAAANDAVGNGKTTGTEIYITKSEKTYGVEENIINNIASLGFRNRHLNSKGEFEPKPANYTVIYYVKSRGVSSALLEVCFIDDKDDMKLYQSKKAEVIKAIANGIVKGFSLKPKYDAITIIKEKIGLEQQTIEYLQAYKYGKELIEKIANAVK